MANEEFGADLITLVDDEGHEHEFEIVDTLELGEQHYVALVADCGEEDCDCEDDGELVILKSDMVDGEEMLVSIEDDDEFDRIGELFLKRLDEIYDDCDCEDDGCDCGCCGHDHQD